MADRDEARWISRIRPGVRRGVFVVGLAVAVLVVGLPAGADSPESGADPSVTLTVNPDDGLSDGQTVFVTGTGFAGGAAGLIRQCAGSVSVPECDTIVSGFFQTDPNGVIPPAPMTVQRVITTFAGTTHNCGVTACFLVADAGGKSARHHIGFAGAGTVPGPSTSAPTTIGNPTSTSPPTTTPPSTGGPTPTTALPSPPVADNILCAIIRALGQALPGLLGGLADSLLRLLGCAPLVVG